MSARKPARKRRPPAARRRRPAAAQSRKRRRGRLAALTAGDRPYALALGVLVVLIVIMAIGPMRSFTAAAERVDALTETRDRLSTAVDDLQERKERLQDPAEVEIIAREELGLVKPGEIPFVVVTPEPEFNKRDPDRQPGSTPDRPWWRRVLDAVGDLIDPAT